MARYLDPQDPIDSPLNPGTSQPPTLAEKAKSKTPLILGAIVVAIALVVFFSQ